MPKTFFINAQSRGLHAEKSTHADAAVTISESPEAVSIGNAWVRVDINLKLATYDIVDVRTGTVAIAHAHGEVDGLGGDPIGYYNGQLKSNTQQSPYTRDWIGGDPRYYYNRQYDSKAQISFNTQDASDALGRGKTLFLYYKRSDNREVITRFSVYEGKGFVALGSGVVNHQSYAIRVKSFQPLCGGDAYPGLTMQKARTLNGAAGSTITAVMEGVQRACENSVLLTFTTGEQRRSLVMGGLTYQDFGKYTAIGHYKCPDNSQLELRTAGWLSPWRAWDPAKVPSNFPANNLQVLAIDPVGRLVAPGETYLPNDWFYVDVTTSDPFEALESYGLNLRTATTARPNVYNTMTLCGWFSGKNTSTLLVDEMEQARQSGLVNRIPLSVRLEPDTYCEEDNGNTQQGWWDDAHWQKYGHLTGPYDTFKKFIQAVKELGGNVETYFQCGMPSDDYAVAYPGQMLGKDISLLHANHQERSVPMVTFDATSKDFQAHMKTVWGHLRDAGLIGVKFDYPDAAWRPEGGFEDKTSTTAAAYRKWFQMCRDGLGADALLHERNLGVACLDVTLGVADLQRVWGDSDKWLPGMTSITGLRWYKNRVVMNYYPDSKSFVERDAQGNRKEDMAMNPTQRQAMITMLYVTSGRIESAISFKTLKPEVVNDISRAFPMHVSPQSARPVDAFMGLPVPRVYVYPVDEQWSQVTFYNEEQLATLISSPLSGDQPDTGSLGLHPDKKYYVYEFWSQQLLGTYSGAGKLEQTMAPGEAKMFSVREVLTHPQVLSTNRHLMQGYVDLKDVKWDAAKKTLSGCASVLGGDTFKIALAANGFKPAKSKADDADVRTESASGSHGLINLVLTKANNGQVNWSIEFE